MRLAGRTAKLGDVCAIIHVADGADRFDARSVGHGAPGRRSVSRDVNDPRNPNPVTLSARRTRSGQRPEARRGQEAWRTCARNWVKMPTDGLDCTSAVAAQPPPKAGAAFTLRSLGMAIRVDDRPTFCRERTGQQRSAWLRPPMQASTMRDFRDAKAMARSLRDALAQKGVTTHTDCLELIALSFGLEGLARARRANRRRRRQPGRRAAAARAPDAAARHRIFRRPRLLFAGRERRAGRDYAFTGEQDVAGGRSIGYRDDPAQDQPTRPAWSPTCCSERHGRPRREAAGARATWARLSASSTRSAHGAPRCWSPAPAISSLPSEAGAGRGDAFQLYAKGRTADRALAAEIAEIAHPGVLADTVAMFARPACLEKQALEMRDPWWSPWLSGGLDRRPWTAAWT